MIMQLPRAASLHGPMIGNKVLITMILLVMVTISPLLPTTMADTAFDVVERNPTGSNITI